MRISLLFFVLTIVFTMSASAMLGSGASYKWWKNPQIVERLNMSPGQVNQIDSIFKSYKKQFINYQKELRSNEVQLKKELQNPNAKKEDVLNLIDGIENTKAAYTRTKVEMFLKIKDVLTPQQQNQLHQIKLRFRPYHR
ncbi:MAG: hypothetical protein AAF462_00560 [Thermodesulfobacteriota bacterium]